MRLKEQERPQHEYRLMMQLKGWLWEALWDKLRGPLYGELGIHLKYQLARELDDAARAETDKLFEEFTKLRANEKRLIESRDAAWDRVDKEGP